MGKGKYTYVVCATVYGTDTPSPELTEVMAGQPVVRRLNRIERVALAFDGSLVRRASRRLLIAFASADTAFFAACEMQRRCADLPHPARNRLLLQIGIHKTTPETRLRLPWPPRSSTERREPHRRAGFDAALRLADVAHGDGIVVSAPVLETLPPTVREIGEVVRHAAKDLPAQAFYWRTVFKNQPAPNVAGIVSEQSGPRLVLSHGRREFKLDSRHSTITFGRDPGCDMRVTSPFASRLHARIQIHGERCILTDLSSNGTSVVFDDGRAKYLRNESIELSGSGQLGFGLSAPESEVPTSFHVMTSTTRNGMTIEATQPSQPSPAPSAIRSRI